MFLGAIVACALADEYKPPAYEKKYDGYFQYANVPGESEYEFGYNRGNPTHYTSRYEQAKDGRFRTKVRIFRNSRCFKFYLINFKVIGLELEDNFVKIGTNRSSGPTNTTDTVSTTGNTITLRPTLLRPTPHRPTPPRPRSTKLRPPLTVLPRPNTKNIDPRLRQNL